jgi:hypothetical protein
VTGDDRRGVQGVGGVESGEPLVDPGHTTGLCQVRVNAVVDDVTRDEQAHFGHMQHRRRVGVGVTDFHREEADAFDLEAASSTMVTSTSPTGSCPGNTRSQKSARNPHRSVRVISSAVPSVARTVTPGNLCANGIAPNQ